MLTIKLPFPDSKLNPNRRDGKSWKSTNEVKQSAFTVAYYATIAELAKLPKCFRFKEQQTPVSIVYVYPDKRRRDLQNLFSAHKSAIDGIAKAIGIDDSFFYPILIDKRIDPGQGCTIVTIGASITQTVSL